MVTGTILFKEMAVKPILINNQAVLAQALIMPVSVISNGNINTKCFTINEYGGVQNDILQHSHP